MSLRKPKAGFAPVVIEPEPNGLWVVYHYDPDDTGWLLATCLVAATPEGLAAIERVASTVRAALAKGAIP